MHGSYDSASHILNFCDKALFMHEACSTLIKITLTKYMFHQNTNQDKGTNFHLLKAGPQFDDHRKTNPLKAA